VAIKIPTGKGWTKVGDIGIDAGLCWVGDPCYVVPDDASYTPTWVEFLQTIKAVGTSSVYPVLQEVERGTGCCVSTGDGDGCYPVYARTDRHGCVRELRVLFERD